MGVRYRTQNVGDVVVFYREAGPPDAPIILLLHGFPTAGHMFRDLIPLLAGGYRVIAPDLPGFGNTKAPPRGQFAYTFDNLANVIGGFIEALDLRRYALYVFDYGAPTGFRIARAHPERVTAIISQNGNAYLEGFSDAWGPWQTYWREPTEERREASRVSLSPKVIREWQYFNGADASRVHLTAIHSTSPTRHGREPRKRSSIWCWIIAVTLRCTMPSRRISGNGSHRSWRRGASATRIASPPVRVRSSAICRRPRCICLTQVTSHSKRMPRRSGD
jgi:pimeloyl-ACP methyl ester carboxylesterase